MNYLVDTCVISELVSRKPNSSVIKWIDAVEQSCLYLSVITIGEISRGIEQSKDVARKEILNNWLKSELLVRFQDRIVPVELGVSLAWGRLTGALASKGKPMPALDSLIAATALHHGLVLATRNLGDFRHSGVKIIDPWNA